MEHCGLNTCLLSCDSQTALVPSRKKSSLDDPYPSTTPDMVDVAADVDIQDEQELE
jgi:hypothetical protein